MNQMVDTKKRAEADGSAFRGVPVEAIEFLDRSAWNEFCGEHGIVRGSAPSGFRPLTTALHFEDRRVLASVLRSLQEGRAGQVDFLLERRPGFGVVVYRSAIGFTKTSDFHQASVKEVQR